MLDVLCTVAFVLIWNFLAGSYNVSKVELWNILDVVMKHGLAYCVVWKLGAQLFSLSSYQFLKDCWNGVCHVYIMFMHVFFFLSPTGIPGRSGQQLERLPKREIC